MTRFAFLFALAAALGAVGCGDDTTTLPTQDLAAVGDLAVPGDMLLGPLACAGVVSCVDNCGENRACRMGCVDAATSDARPHWDAFAGCVAETCGGGDAGAGSCAGPDDTSIACATCLRTVAEDAATAGRACHAEFADCLAH